MAGMRKPSDFDREYRRETRIFGVAFGAWFLFCTLIGLAMLGLIGWAIIRLVLHFT